MSQTDATGMVRKSQRSTCYSQYQAHTTKAFTPQKSKNFQTLSGSSSAELQFLHLSRAGSHSAFSSLATDFPYCGFCTAGASCPRSQQSEFYSDSICTTFVGVDILPLQHIRYQTEPLDKELEGLKVSFVQWS